MDNRTNRLQILLTTQERITLNATANEQGLAPSAYARAEIIKACKRDKGSDAVVAHRSNRLAKLVGDEWETLNWKLVKTGTHAPIYGKITDRGSE